MYKITNIMTIEEAIDELELLKWQEGVTDFIITEEFSKTKEFLVRNLSVGIENDVIFCWGENDIIEEIGSILIGFLRHHLLSINKIYDNYSNASFGLFKFEDGTVTIKTS